MEELDLKSMLEKFNEGGFLKGEQIILANNGTNQTLLTLIFQVPCKVLVVSQFEEPEIILRHVELLCGGKVVCKASTTIPKDKNNTVVLADILDGKLGLGQILTRYNLACERNLLSYGRDSNIFWRSYVIKGPEVYLEINEIFQSGPFKEIGWIGGKT
ncbi:hypothetical protein LCGC14_1463200 [marine sediment metagenome]|uniref:Uncharacterized protein n=1 Tax=marine sediment metagenome TaxID=412755 RepID=A0A0F9K0H5_9ZZZZ